MKTGRGQPVPTSHGAPRCVQGTQAAGDNDTSVMLMSLSLRFPELAASKPFATWEDVRFWLRKGRRVTQPPTPGGLAPAAGGPLDVSHGEPVSARLPRGAHPTVPEATERVAGPR